MAPFPEFLSLNLRTLAAKHYYRPVHADPADLKRFQELQRVTVDEELGPRISAQAARWISSMARIGPLQ